MPPDNQITSDSDLDLVLEEFKLRQTRRDSTGPKYRCSIAGCTESFKRLDHLDRHEYHHTGIKKHACSYDGCDKVYTILTHLKRHLRSTHERPGDGAPQKTVKCQLEECSKMFTSACNMQRHMREAHEAPREYACTHCEAKFRQKMKLRRHEITQHTQAYPYRCKKCARGFYQQWQQESHQRSCKLYSCPACELQFDKWTLYTKHCRETLHGRERHKCKQCERSYDKPSDLSKHVLAKHSADEKAAFTCSEPDCGRSYAYERNLRQHMLTTHSGMRFECQAVNCDRCFSSAQNLSKHLLRDHTAKERKSKSKSPSATAAAVKEKSNLRESTKLTRKRRRDAGKPVRSHLSKLACLVLEKDVDKELRLRQPLALTTVAQELEAELDDSVMEELLTATLES
ncbi:transcription factor IIIA isoform X1 [Drosophila busckii]|nr:transcription factor IIIA isoform X1 [Drosophila busckii]